MTTGCTEMVRESTSTMSIAISFLCSTIIIGFALRTFLPRTAQDIGGWKFSWKQMPVNAQ